MALVVGIGLELVLGMAWGMGLVLKLRLQVVINSESKPGILGLGGEAQKPSLTLSGRSQCSRSGWGSEESGCPLQWPSAE